MLRNIEEIGINIDNLQEETVITYPLLLIKGFVKHKSEYNCTNCIKIILNAANVETKVDLLKNKFKFLIELLPGDNILKFRTFCSNRSIKVTYKEYFGQTSILPLYVICAEHDGRFQSSEDETNTPESACARITTGCKVLQSVVAEKLNELDLGRKTFQLSQCEIFRSKLHYESARKMKQQDLWEYLAREILKSEVSDENKKYLAFLSCTKYNGGQYKENMKSYEELIRLTEGYVALGGGGLAIFGTACLYTWPENFNEILDRFQSNKAVNRNQFLDDSCYRGTLGGCLSTTLGSVLHELCHTFGLGHTDKGIMGRGFDNIEKIFLISDTSSPKTQSSIANKTNQNSIRNVGFCNKITEKNLFCEDETYFTKSCAAFLSYHRWLNVYETSKRNTLVFDQHLMLVKSTFGIRVVEIRRTIDEFVLHSWIFTGKVLKYSFRIPLENIKTETENLVLVAIDNSGDILKQNICTRK